MNPAAPVTRTRILRPGRRGRGRWRNRRSLCGPCARDRRGCGRRRSRDREPLLDQVEIGRPEHLPFGEDCQRVGALERRLLGAAEREVVAVAVDALGLLHRLGVVGLDGGAGVPERLHQHAAGRLAHVVGVGLERQAPEREGLSFEVAFEMRADLFEDHRLLRVVAVLDRLHERRLEAGAARGVDQRLHVLGEARAAVAGAGIDEMVADALVRADALADHLDVGAEPLGEAGDLVHEADLGREHAVGGVFRQLRRAHVHHDDLVVVAVEGLVDLAQHFLGLGVGGADDDAVGAHAIGDRGAFLEEFGVRDHVEAEIRAAALQRLGHARAHLVGGAHRHGGLVEDDLRRGHVLGDGRGHREHVLQVGRAVLVGRRADGDELDAAVRDALRRIGGEVQPARRHDWPSRSPRGPARRSGSRLPSGLRPWRRPRRRTARHVRPRPEPPPGRARHSRFQRR